MTDAFPKEPSVIERTRVALRKPAQPPWNAILSKVKNLALAKGPAWLAAGMNPESRDVKGFEMEPQLYKNWCWAAVGASIGRLSKVGPRPEQCKVAQDQVKDPDCCKGPWYVDDKPYDKLGSLRDALKFVGCYRDMRCHENNTENYCAGVDPKKPSLTEIQNEIGANNPVCFRIGWGERRHFVVISGLRPGGLVVVKDPDGGTTKQFVDYDQFPGTEKGAILWNTYFIKRD